MKPEAMSAVAPAPSALRGQPLVAWLLLTAIVAAGIALRCYGLTTRSLWFDEAFTYWVSQFPLDELWHRVIHDNHPPLHYVLLHFWTAIFGTSLGALRSLGVLLGGLTIIGCYLFTVEALRGRAGRAPASSGRESGLWVAAMVALSIMQIRWSWDVRMYSLGAPLAAFSSWALFRALHSWPQRYDLWLVYSFLALLLAYTHYFGLFTIVAQGAFVAGYLTVLHRRFWLTLHQPPRWCAVSAAAIIGLGWLPWLPIFLHQHSKLPSDFWVPPVSLPSIRAAAYHLLIEPESYVAVEASPIAEFCVLFFCAVPLILLFKEKIGARSASKVQSSLACAAGSIEWYVVSGTMIPVGLSLFVSIVFHTEVFYSRYFLFAQLFFLASLGLLISSMRHPWIRRLVGGALLLLMLGLDLRFIDKMDLEHHTSFRGAAAYIESQRRPGEPVVVCSQLFYLPLRYHAVDSAHWYQFGHDCKPGGLDAWTAMGAENAIDTDGLHVVTSCRVWVVNTSADSPGHCPVPVPPHWLPVCQVTFTDTYNIKTDIVIVEYDTMLGAGK